MTSRVDELIAKGAVQVSRKYRRVFVPPAPCTEYLRKNLPETYDNLVEDTLQQFETEARQLVWIFCDETKIELTPAEFTEFYEKVNGRKVWTPEGKVPCPSCRSLGHIHRRSCPEAT